MRRYNNIDKLALQRAIPQIVSYRKMNFAGKSIGPDKIWWAHLDEKFSDKKIKKILENFTSKDKKDILDDIEKFNSSTDLNEKQKLASDITKRGSSDKNIFATFGIKLPIFTNNGNDNITIIGRYGEMLNKIKEWVGTHQQNSGSDTPMSNGSSQSSPQQPASAPTPVPDASQTTLASSSTQTSDKKKLNDLKKEFHEDMNKYLKKLKSDKDNKARAEFFKDLLLCFERTGDKKVGFTSSVNRVAQIGERIHPLSNDENYYLKQQQDICDNRSAQGMADLAEFQCSVMKDITAAAQNIGNDLGDTKLKELVFKDDDGDTLKNLWNVIRKIDVNSKDAETQGFFEKYGTNLAIGGAIALGGLALGKLVSHLREKARRRREARVNRQ